MIAYVVAILAEVPFVNSTFYVGPFVKPLGEADVSWIVGMVVAAVLYVVLVRPTVSGETALPHHVAAVRE
jgi:NCS1 family nucleobase:cation symporter-1